MYYNIFILINLCPVGKGCSLIFNFKILLVSLPKLVNQIKLTRADLKKLRSDECIDFTMLCVFFVSVYMRTCRNNARNEGGFRFVIESSWCIGEVIF
ncbi:Uncharacterized protein FWK35_00029164 [Aphis craccivora]|uniref:Uncharacterized protein n=1 Tax=Aphis craccivora TaxID=307492 RepID=A0A6G0VY95_APHCR|nr:Uncharacterized protein FWK35_00029164 [Aphis craccivora]